MAGKGGYQRPAHPAPVSGIGKHSQRTDGGPAQTIRSLPQAGYGENKAFTDLQRQAPVPATGPVAPAQPGGPGGPGGPAPMPDRSGEVTPFSAPTARPDEPVTAGVPIGPGPGPEALTLPQQSPQSSYGSLVDILSGLSASDMTGSMAALQQQATALGLGQ